MQDSKIEVVRKTYPQENMTENYTQVKSEQHDDDGCKMSFKKFQNYRRYGTLCDITIITMNERFPAHKVVLSSATPYFKQLFTEPLTEKQNEISIEGVTEPAVSTCLKFIYHEEFDIEMEEVGDLLHAVYLFQLKELKQRCMEMLQKNIAVNNCVEIYKLSQVYGFDHIQMKSLTIILENAEKLFQNDKVFVDLDAGTLKMMVKSEDLSVSDESVIFEALLKWIAVDEEERKGYFCEMLEFIRLPTVGKDYFTDVIWTNNHIQNECKKCKEYATDCLLHIADKKTRGLKDYQLRKRRYVKEKQSEIVVVTQTKYNEPSSISKFDVDNDSFSDYIPTEEITMKVYPWLFCFHNDALYLFDARNSKCMFCYQYDKWHGLPQLAEMQGLSFAAHLTSYKDYLLVIGGLHTKAVYCFNVPKKEWVPFPSLNKIHCHLSSVQYHDCVYVMGGLNNGRLSASVERYNPLLNKWQMMPKMNQARRDHASAVYQDKIFVAGGWYGSKRLTSVETFREGDDAWTPIQNLNVERDWLSLFVKQDTLYAFGGEREDGSSLYETFDEESESWKESRGINQTEASRCKVLVK